MFNFCDPSLKPVVTCNTISNEGYEVSNLISNEVTERQKGFLAYNSIKPPVDITFGFICRINLSHVIIWPQVGFQKSSGFEVLTSSNSNSVEQIQSTNGIQQHRNFDMDLGNGFEKVGYAFINKETGIVFHITGIPTSSHAPNFLRSTLHNKGSARLNNINSLRIRILKTYNSSVPAVAKVEIWGSPSDSCSQDKRTAVLQLWNSRLSVGRQVKTSKQEVHDISKVKPDSDNAASLVPHSIEFKIPEEFLDAITCEMMVIPLILPCGKIVDQSTLEKHENIEANWGRAPSDPFTGILFTNVNRPIMAIALKARMDKFIVEHIDQTELQNIPRTLGRKQSVSILESKLSQSSGAHRGCGNTIKKNSSDLITSCSTNENTLRRDTSVHISRNSSDKLKHKHKHSLLGISKRVKHSETAVSSANEGFKRARNTMEERSTTASTQQSHEDTLDESLDSALKCTLSGLPSFLNFDADVEVSTNLNRCTECHITESLFKLPCGHLICRSCLVLKTKLKSLCCTICKAAFRSCDPERYHLV